MSRHPSYWPPGAKAKMFQVEVQELPSPAVPPHQSIQPTAIACGDGVGVGVGVGVELAVGTQFGMLAHDAFAGPYIVQT